MEIPPDVCSHGHPLAPGSTPITITTILPDGKAQKETKLLRNHKVLVPGPVKNMTADIPLDPTGLAPASCSHGLPEHPDPEVQAAAKAGSNSWIRAKYLDLAGKPPKPVCPVCLGQPRPDDLTTPRNAV